MKARARARIRGLNNCWLSVPVAFSSGCVFAYRREDGFDGSDYLGADVYVVTHRPTGMQIGCPIAGALRTERVVTKLGRFMPARVPRKSGRGMAGLERRVVSVFREAAL